MASIVYSLCAVGSIYVAYLLTRAYRQKPSRILFWSAICFAGMALNNIVLFIDLVVLPTTVTLGLLRNAIVVSSVSVMVYGLIWDTV